MTEPMPPTNGRVTQRDLYDAIGGMRAEMHEGFAEVRRDMRDLGERVRGVELQQIQETASDDARNLMIREQRELKHEAGVSRRWLVGLFIANVTSIGVAALSVIVRTG